jgi:hypothetical protein
MAARFQVVSPNEVRLARRQDAVSLAAVEIHLPPDTAAGLQATRSVAAETGVEGSQAEGLDTADSAGDSVMDLVIRSSDMASVIRSSDMAWAMVWDTVC